jgi:hypothetical protein
VRRVENLLTRSAVGPIAEVQARHTRARSKPFHALADRDDVTCAVPARNAPDQLATLVVDAEHFPIAAVQPDRTHANEHLAVARLRHRRLDELPAIAGLGLFQNDLARGGGYWFARMRHAD